MLLSCAFLQISQKRIIIPLQQFHIAVNLHKDSSSSDSSDSDSDNKISKRYINSKVPSKKKITMHKDNSPLYTLYNERKSQNPVNVTVHPKKMKPGNVERNETGQELYGKKVVDAAKNITAKLQEKNKVQVESDLLALARSIDNSKRSVSPSNISNIITGMKIEAGAESKKLLKKISVVKNLTKSKSVIGKLSSEWNRKILDDYSRGNALSIFCDNRNSSVKSPEMPTWELVQQLELKRTLTQPPRNVFQEIIEWTQEGKLWNFPIDNEQGMVNEQSIHFSEHIFIDRHLKDWCPKKGPIRHFMELVCVGLSKNPYLTVEEKVDHLTWFKDYFKQHADLLQDVGAVDTSDISNCKPKQLNV